ncbi:MAG TPA: glutamine synthetase family protein [Acidimicrobiales bacterium]|nr:glutamine synthetase family protein [Acidimicrobiales bacterium]
MIDTEELRWVRLVFVDVFGGAHAVVLPAARFSIAVEKGAPFDGSALEGRARHLEADMLLKPDPLTLLTLGDGQARAACTVVGPDGRPWPGDPRTALAALLNRIGELAEGYRAAAELEYYVLDQDGLPIDRGGYFGELEAEGSQLARAAADRLSSAGINVISTHLEAGPGQYELDLGSMAPMALADGLVLAKQVLREEAAAFGLRVTFMARPFAGQAGSGLHLHQHVNGALFDDQAILTDEGRAFVAGQLTHAAGLSALAAPNVNSYKRLHSGPEAPSDAMWGHLNRAALVRVGWSGERRPAIEFRLADPSANPYLLLGGLLAAAADGLEAGLDPGEPFEEDLGGFDPATAMTVQVRPLPRDLDGALDALLADDVLVDAFDSRLLSRLVDGRRAEAEAYRAQVTAWEVERYLDEA